MRVGWFASILGMALSEGEEPDPAVAWRISEEAEDFLRAGGTLEAQAWALLEPWERRAFRDAGDRIRTEMAGAIAAAMQNPTLARAFLAGQDPEDALTRQLVSATADHVEASLRPEEAP